MKDIMDERFHSYVRWIMLGAILAVTVVYASPVNSELISPAIFAVAIASILLLEARSEQVELPMLLLWVALFLANAVNIGHTLVGGELASWAFYVLVGFAGVMGIVHVLEGLDILSWPNWLGA